LPKSNLIVYKGFYGSVHYSAADEVFYGKIEGVKDLVTFECKSVIALESAFQESVDAYVKIIQDNFSTSR
jgi:predicted HicB family RNase H-like nuclease